MNNDIAKRLHETRMQMGLSLRGLADMVKVSYGTLHHIELGKVRPRPQTVVKLNKALWPDSPIDVATVAKEHQQMMSNRKRKESASE